MKLLLTSAGLTNKTISNALLELTGRPFAELNLAFVPTASNIVDEDKSWVIDDLVNCKKLGFKSIDIVDISALPKEIWQPRLEAADILMFGGGNVFYLMKWIKKSGLQEILPEMLETKIYVGSSAGGMVTSKRNSLVSIYFEGEYANESMDGLGFVDFQIRPHLNDPGFPNANIEHFKEISQKHPEIYFYAIDDNTAIKVVNGEMEVVSEGVWKRFN